MKRYALLVGREADAVREVPDQKVKVAFFSGAGPGAAVPGGRLELVAPTSPESPLSRFLEKHGEGLHHVCIHVDDIEKTLSRLQAAGVKLIDETPRLGAEGNRIAFVHPSGSGGVLVELEERSG